jgi:hypothetical protein
VRGLEETRVVTEVLDEDEVLGEDGRLAGFEELVEGVQGYEEAEVGQVPSLDSLDTVKPPTSLERIVFAVFPRPKDPRKPIQTKHQSQHYSPCPEGHPVYQAHLVQTPFLVPKGSTQSSSLEIFQASARGRIGTAPSVRAWWTGKRSTVGVSKASTSGLASAPCIHGDNVGFILAMGSLGD